MKKHVLICLITVGLTGLFANVHSCSSVCLNKKGQVILGNNMDWISGEGMVVVNKRNVLKRGFWYENNPEWTWTSKYGSITFTTEGREFPIRGMNEAGLAIVEMSLDETLYPPTDNLPVLSGSQWIQYQLDNSATVEEVIASQSVVRIEPTDWQGMAPHFLICDSSGNIAGIEWLNGELIVYSDSTLPIPIMVNSTYASCITNGDDPSGRFKPIAALYAAYDTVQPGDGVSYVFTMLQAATMNSPLFQTRWSMAYDVFAMRCFWKTGMNNRLRYVDFRDFDFSCGTDVMVLDINSADTGNVHSAFIPYTVDVNRDLIAGTYTLYNQYSTYIGKSYSQDTIDAIIMFPESTFCDGSNIINPLHSFASGKFLLYSIPKSTSIRIELTEPVSNHIAVSLFDMHGRLIVRFSERMVQTGKNSITRKLPNVTQGMYYCKINAGENTYSRPIVIQR